MPTLLLAVTTTADQPDLSRWVTLAVLAFLGWQLMLIVAFPYGPHRPCKGSGKRWNGKHFRRCRGCQGTGRKVRFGRRVWDWTVSTKESIK